MRRKLRELMALAAGKAAHPVFGLPGGVSKPLTEDDAARFREVADEAVDFACFTLEVFEKIVLGNSEYVNLILSDAFTHRTYYMGLVDEKNRVNFYDGALRVVAPDGHEWAKFRPARISGPHRRARRALDLHEVLLSEGTRLEGLIR